MEMGKPCSRNAAAQMGTCNIDVRCKIRQKENWATEDTFKTAAGGEWSQIANTGTHNVGKIHVTDSADLSIRWLHQCV